MPHPPRDTPSSPSDADDAFRALMEHLPAFVYIEELPADGEQGRLRYVGPQVETLLGFPPHEWVADPLAWARQLHPDDRDRVRAIYERVERTGETFRAEYRMLARDGSVRWFRDEATVVRDQDGRPVHWQGVMVDITARKAAEAGLSEAEARYRALVELLPGIAYIDPADGEGTTYISPQTTAILGYTPEDWYADPNLWRSIVHPDDRARVDAGGTDPYASTYRLIARDGREVWMRDQARPVYDEAGQLLYWQGLLLDVTEQRRATELERELDVERVDADRLRAEDEIKTTFLQAVAHDVRTPLAAILGLAVTLERDDLTLAPGEARDLAHRIAQNARRVDGMVADILDLERLRRGVADLSFQPVDVGTLAREIASDRDVVGDRRVTVDAGPATVDADGQVLARIIENLLGNTVKHTPATSQMWVRVEATETVVELIVDDDGPGVHDEDKDRVFEPFQQGRDAAAGSGVGLALVARFAELHGGRAWVEDRPGGGASFHVTIARTAAERRVDLTPFERDQPTPTGSEAESQA
jgi:PAS domain S-box-containing protein